MWNHDISAAPRGRMVTVMKNTKTKDGMVRVPVQEFEPDILWLASSCGKVLRSYWVPANGRHDGYWAGFAQKGGTPPVAWQAYVVPEHPFNTDTATDSRVARTPLGGMEAVTESGAGVAKSAGPAISFIDDVGSI